VPIRDRIDINQAFLPLRKTYLKKATPQRSESSSAVAVRVLEARMLLLCVWLSSTRIARMF
jgi:hypothetical protein